MGKTKIQVWPTIAGRARAIESKIQTINFNSIMQTKESSNPMPISEQEIATRAYYLWEQHGKPGQRDLEFWTMAEAELISGRGSQPTEAMMKNTETDRRRRGAARSSGGARGSVSATDMPKIGERSIVQTEARKASAKRATS